MLSSVREDMILSLASQAMYCGNECRQVVWVQMVETISKLSECHIANAVIARSPGSMPWPNGYKGAPAGYGVVDRGSRKGSTSAGSLSRAAQ
jgi:hypothetical protein